MSYFGRPIESLRMFAYLGFCIGSVWCITNTPIGEYVLRSKKYIVVHPDKSTPDYDEELKEKLIKYADDNAKYDDE